MGGTEMSKELTIEEQVKHIMEENALLKNEIDRLNKQKESLARRLQNAEEFAEKLEHLSTFSESASEIAHEINNPVNFVSGSLSIVKRGVKDFIELMEMYHQLQGFENQPQYKKIQELEDDIDIDLTKKELTDASNIIEKGMERIHEIAHNLSLLGKRESAAPIRLNVNQSISDTLLMITEKVKGQMEIRTEWGNIPEIMSYRGKLNQVFTNVIKNSVEAVQSKPNPSNEFLNVKTELNNDRVIITISDSGTGMSPETLERIFEKFYTTKSPGKGKGLGMGVCKAIVEKHNGTIEVESEKGKGTTVTIVLPLKH